MKTNRRRFLVSMFGGAAAVAAAPAAALVPAVVNETPVDAAPVFNEMMRKLSEAGGGILKAAARTYHTYSPLRLQSYVTLDIAGAEIMRHGDGGCCVEDPAGVKDAGMVGGYFTVIDTNAKFVGLQFTG